MNDIETKLQSVLQTIREAEKKSSRAENSVRLLAVSKFHPLNLILDAIAAGQFFFGENRVQEAREKFFEVFKTQQNVRLHLIGSLQKNKVSHAVKIAHCIESVDRITLLQELQRICEKQNKKIEILFELHTAEDSKAGFENFASLHEAVELCANGNFPNIIPKGFMTMAPFTNDEKLIRKSFITLRETKEKLQKEFSSLSLSELSMGMSGDYKIAIEEGSTEVRIGTAIFGERN